MIDSTLGVGDRAAFKQTELRRHFVFLRLIGASNEQLILKQSLSRFQTYRHVF
jgi:hypothetical protein